MMNTFASILLGESIQIFVCLLFVEYINRRRFFLSQNVPHSTILEKKKEEGAGLSTHCILHYTT